MKVECKKRPWQCVMIALVPGASLMGADYGQAATDLALKGALVAAACTIRVGDEALAIDLGKVGTHYLYLNTRTQGQTFQIHLEGCDTSISDKVTTTFSGSESIKLPGLLALDGSIEKGVAIGLETLAGAALPLNVASDRQVLSNGANVIALKAFVKAEPQAIANRLIKPGQYSAVSTFTLGYP